MANDLVLCGDLVQLRRYKNGNRSEVKSHVYHDLEYQLKLMKYNKAYKQRTQKLEDLGMTYEEYLQSDLWKKIKKRAKNMENGNVCVSCSLSNPSIELHHVSYSKIHKDTLCYLVPLCRTCHQHVHDYSKKMNVSLIKASRDTCYNEFLDHVEKKHLFTRKWFKKFWGEEQSVSGFKQPQGDKRQLSLEIVKSSGVPATLHHSLNSTLGNWVEDNGHNYRRYIIEWVERKKRKDDFIMLGIYFKYAEKVEAYLSWRIDEF